MNIEYFFLFTCSTNGMFHLAAVVLSHVILHKNLISSIGKNSHRNKGEPGQLLFQQLLDQYFSN